MVERKITRPPWTVIDYTGTGKGYIGIRGPAGEKICDIFPFAGDNGVGIEQAKENAIQITLWANEALQAVTSHASADDEEKILLRTAAEIEDERLAAKGTSSR